MHLFSGVGLKDCVEQALKDGGVQDDQKVKSMCRYILQSKSDGTVKNIIVILTNGSCFVTKTVMMLCQHNQFT